MHPDPPNSIHPAIDTTPQAESTILVAVVVAVAVAVVAVRLNRNRS